MRKKAVVIHSGGMDSSICLALAIKEFGRENVLSLSFSYTQRHENEIMQAQYICSRWNVDNKVVKLNTFTQLTSNALLDHDQDIIHEDGKPPNTLVMCRNGLMATLGAIQADHVGAHIIYMGVIEVDQSNSGYRDCSRNYIDLKQSILRIDLGNPQFEIRTPLVYMTKKETLELAEKLNVLDFLLEHTITCYEGIPKEGCRKCPSCLLRNEGIAQYYEDKKTRLNVAI